MSIQLVIIIAYLVLTVLIGRFTSRSTDTSTKFHGTQLGVSAIVFISAGEWLGGTATTGVSEWGFNYGISGAWYTIANGLGVMFLAIFFAKIYRSIGRMTVPGIIDTIFGKSAQVVSGILLVLVMLAVGISQIIAAGKFGQALLNIDFRISAAVFTVIFLIYTLLGGMQAVKATNTMHLLVMYVGIITAVLILLSKLGGWSNFISGISQVESSEGGNYFSMTAIGFPKVSSWIIASLLGACTAQAGIQPLFASKDIPTAKKACVITALITAPFGIFSALIGMMAKVMANQNMLLDASGNILTDGKLAMTSVLMALPPTIGGVVLASEFAAILSTVSPIMLAAGTMLTKDFYQVVIDPKANDRKILFVSRIATAIAGIVCCLGSIFLAENNGVLDIIYSAYSLRGALFIVLIFGLLYKKADATAACISMVLTGITAIFWAGCKLVIGTYPIAGWFTETYAAILVAFISMFLLSNYFHHRKKNIENI